LLTEATIYSIWRRAPSDFRTFGTLEWAGGLIKLPRSKQNWEKKEIRTATDVDKCSVCPYRSHLISEFSVPLWHGQSKSLIGARGNVILIQTVWRLLTGNRQKIKVLYYFQCAAISRYYQQVSGIQLEI